MSAVDHQITLVQRMVGSSSTFLQCVRDMRDMLGAFNLEGVCFESRAARAEASQMHLQSRWKEK